MALFLPQTKSYARSRHRKKKGKSRKQKLSHKSPTSDANSTESSLSIGSIYRENQNDNLCKKHALATIISTVMSERELSQIQQNEEKGDIDNRLNRRKSRKLKKKWKSPNYLSRGKYNKLCDSFDRANKFDIGISRRYFVIGDTTKHNIFSYILEQFNIKSDYIAFDEKDGSIHKLLNIIEEKLVRKLIAFNYEHAWCYICLKDVWFEIDSLKKRKNTKIIQSFPYNCGYIYVYD